MFDAEKFINPIPEYCDNCNKISDGNMCGVFLHPVLAVRVGGCPWSPMENGWLDEARKAAKAAEVKRVGQQKQQKKK